MEDRLTLITSALQRIQEKGGRENFVIFTSDIKKNYYIQFLGKVGQPTLYAEAVSNQFLPAGAALTDEQMRHLRELGWQPPNRDTPNFHRQWEAPDEVACQEIARQVLQAFEMVYGFTSGQPLSVDFGFAN